MGLLCTAAVCASFKRADSTHQSVEEEDGKLPKHRIGLPLFTLICNTLPCRVHLAQRAWLRVVVTSFRVGAGGPEFVPYILRKVDYPFTRSWASMLGWSPVDTGQGA